MSECFYAVTNDYDDSHVWLTSNSDKPDKSLGGWSLENSKAGEFSRYINSATFEKVFGFKMRRHSCIKISIDDLDDKFVQVEAKQDRFILIEE